MSNQTTDIAKAPGTDAPDGSALALKTVGQIHITIGWLVGGACLIFGTVGAIQTADSLIGPVPAVILAIIGVIIIVRGYSKGARAKATAKAAIEATKAAERTSRMEQMMANMVSGSGQVAQPQAQVKCPKCGAAIPGSVKFCPECGASTKAKCVKCGAEMTADAKFCPECGAKCE